MLANTATAATDAASAPRVKSVVRADARTGRLVRRVVVSPAARAAETRPATVDQLVRQAAKTYHVDPLLVHSVIQVESNYNPYAVSPKGALGLMQLVPATARRFGVTDPFNPRENIDAGVKYLKYLKDMFQDDRLALAAYNAGEGAVAKYGWIPPYPETRNYVQSVGKKYSEARREAVRQPASAAPPANHVEAPVADPVRHVESFIDDQGRLHLTTR